MNGFMRIRRGAPVAALLALMGLAACDSDPVGLDGDGATALVVGQVRIAAASGGGGGASLLSGIEVSVDGSASSDITDDNGVFRVEARSDDGRVRLRFRRGSMDLVMEVGGVQAGSVLQIAVTLSGASATLDDSSSSDRDEFEGEAALSGLSGVAPDRTMTLEVSAASGSWLVDVVEGSTAFEADGDITTFDHLLARVEAGLQVRVEGDATPGNNGHVTAVTIKAETDENDDSVDDDSDDSDDEFDGDLVTATVSGVAPARMVRLVLSDEGRDVLVDVTEGVTVFEADGDLRTLDDLLVAAAAGLEIEIEGEGVIGQDGVFAAQSIEVEIEGDDDEAFDGDIVTLSVSGTAPTRIVRVELLDDGVRATADIVEGSTVFDTDGDVLSVEALIAAHGTGLDLEIEGDGTLQDDGSFVATHVEVEIDD